MPTDVIHANSSLLTHIQRKRSYNEKWESSILIGLEEFVTKVKKHEPRVSREEKGFALALKFLLEKKTRCKPAVRGGAWRCVCALISYRNVVRTPISLLASHVTHFFVLTHFDVTCALSRCTRTVQ